MTEHLPERDAEMYDITKERRVRRKDLSVKFLPPEVSEEMFEPTVVEPDDKSRPYTERRLRERIGETTLGRMTMDSFGMRNLKHPEKGGWYIAGGLMIITAAGWAHFHNKHKDESVLFDE